MLIDSLIPITIYRRLLRVFSRAFGEDLAAVDRWAAGFLSTSTRKALVFETRTREIVDGLLGLVDWQARKLALDSLSRHLGDEHDSIDSLAKEIIRTPHLSRSDGEEAPTTKTPRRRPPPSTDPIPRGELDLYLARAESQHRYLRIIGLDTAVRMKMQLDDLYAPLDVMIDNTRQDTSVSQFEEVPLSEIFVRARDLGKRGVMMLGDPGSGKTTRLEQVLLKIVKDGPESIGLPPGTVPVFLPLRDLGDPERGLLGFIRRELKDQTLGMEPDFGERLCRRGKLILLLDGLDEVANAAKRAEVARWIEELRRAGHDSYFLVSSRYAGYTKDIKLDPSFLELHLRPLTDQQMRTFVTRWYAIVERAAHEDPQEAAVEADRRTRNLLDTLSHPDFTTAQVYGLTRNPLLLTAICLVHRNRGRLPRAHTELYEECISVLQERWQTKVTNPPLPVDPEGG